MWLNITAYLHNLYHESVLGMLADFAMLGPIYTLIMQLISFSSDLDLVKPQYCKEIRSSGGILSDLEIIIATYFFTLQKD